MRTRHTNFLQATILITGITYSLIGIVFYFSPIAFGYIFAIDINEDWLKEIPKDTFISLLYYLARGFSAMMFAAGSAMILPLFDPLRYRGLIYFTGVVFPLLALIILLTNGIILGHGVITVFGVFFSIVFILTALGLIVTKQEAKSGIE